MVSANPVIKSLHPAFRDLILHTYQAAIPCFYDTNVEYLCPSVSAISHNQPPALGISGTASSCFFCFDGCLSSKPRNAEMLSAAASTLSPLPAVLSKGLIAVSTLSLLSFLCTTTLFLYLTYRLVTWHFRAGGNQAPNQFLILIYNLLLADIQQACAFLLNIASLRNNAVVVGNSTCWAQGWFVSTGDLASSMFILAIALHTFLGVVRDYRLPSVVFYGCIAVSNISVLTTPI